MADALDGIALAIQRLGNADAATPFGGLEALGMVLKEGLDRVADSLMAVADAIRESND